MDAPAQLSVLFSKLNDYAFESSKGYSFLLQNVIKFDGWPEMADFLDWWDLEKLMPEDYAPYLMNNGKSVMSLAEQTYIAKSKALLRLNDPGRIEEFLPQLDLLLENHPEYIYPGYFYGKLLLSLGSDKEDALRVLLPFARKKSSQFWVWQLLSDVFVNEPEKQLACLLRAVNCRTQENFLGKVRIKLANIYIQRNEYDLARYQIDKITKTYLSQGWHLPYDVDIMLHQPWINSVAPNDCTPVDYMSITDEILCEGTEETLAIVVYHDLNTKKSTLIYGKEKRTIQRLRFKVEVGAVLKMNYIRETDGRIRLLSAHKDSLPANLDYAKELEGKVRKRSDKDFAFLVTRNGDYFIPPHVVSKCKVQDSESIKCLVVYDFNHKMEKWGWVCISVNQLNN